MPPALRVGLALLVATLYFFGSYYYGARSGESLSLMKGQHRSFINTAKEPERFAENQRRHLEWGTGFLTVGAIITVYGLAQRRRQKMT